MTKQVIAEQLVNDPLSVALLEVLRVLNNGDDIMKFAIDQVEATYNAHGLSETDVEGQPAIFELCQSELILTVKNAL